MEAFYFADNKRLFGSFSPAQGVSARHAVLICAPIAHEYYKAHFVLRRLAQQLSEAGCDVLRFDFSGYGDSWGDPPTAATLQSDVVEAMRELTEMTACEHHSIVAVRYACSTLGLIDTPLRQLVLWDPVTDGDSYASELRQAHDGILAKHSRVQAFEEIIDSDELMGMQGADRLLSSIQQHSAQMPQATTVSCVVSSNYEHPSELDQAKMIDVESTSPWSDVDLRLMYSQDVVRAIETELCQ